MSKSAHRASTPRSHQRPPIAWSERLRLPSRAHCRWHRPTAPGCVTIPMSDTAHFIGPIRVGFAIEVCASQRSDAIRTNPYKRAVFHIAGLTVISGHYCGWGYIGQCARCALPSCQVSHQRHGRSSPVATVRRTCAAGYHKTRHVPYWATIAPTLRVLTNQLPESAGMGHIKRKNRMLLHTR